MTTQSVPRRALFLLLILTLLWGTNWPLFAFAVRELSVWTFRAIAVFFAGVALLAVGRMRGHSLVIPRPFWLTICAASFFYLVVWNISSTYSAILIPSGQSAVLGFTMPLWSALISSTVLGQRLTCRLVLAILFGTAAVLMLMARASPPMRAHRWVSHPRRRLCDDAALRRHLGLAVPRRCRQPVPLAQRRPRDGVARQERPLHVPVHSPRALVCAGDEERPPHGVAGQARHDRPGRRCASDCHARLPRSFPIRTWDAIHAGMQSQVHRFNARLVEVNGN